MRCQPLTLLALAAASATAAHAAGLESVSRLAFGPDGVLFVADWKEARVHALTLPAAAARRGEGTFNVLDLQALLAKSLGRQKLSIEDMAARPGTGEVYLALSLGAARTPAIVSVTSDNVVRRLNLKTARSTSVALAAASTSTFAFWKDIPERSYTVTDMKWHDGELYVAGLSNQDFASTLRRIPYPFKGEQSTTSVEIYHTTHNQIETRAPIRAMTFASWGGKPYLVAAYTCTPLVTIPLEDLKDGAHIRGKSVAELGYGNTPASMISFTRTSQGKSQDMLMLVNYERDSDIIPVAQVEAAAAKPAIDKPVPFGRIEGLEPIQAPLVGAMRIDNLDDKFFVVVRRMLEKDALQLVSVDKDLNFRLSDFVSEYNFPQYGYKGDKFQLQYLKPAQDMLMKQEGYADLVKSDH